MFYIHLARQPVQLASLRSILRLMRFNPLAFVFAPGMALGGLLIGGISGAQSALAAGLLIVGTASVWMLIRGPIDTSDGQR